MNPMIDRDNNAKAAAWEENSTTFSGYAATMHVPLGGTFELTARCNLRCKMCYIRLDPQQIQLLGKELTAKEWIELGKEAAAAGTLHLLITGGEPLLRDDFEEIYTALNQMGFIITLNTNATLMNDRYLKLFQKYPPTAVNITLYGASPETYGSVCGHTDGFEKTVRGLEMLASTSSVLEVRTTFIKDNLSELGAVRTIANRFSKRFAINPLVFDSVRGAVSDAKNCRLEPHEIFNLDLSHAMFYNDINNSVDPEHHARKKAPVKRDFKHDLPPKILTCLGAKSIYWITWDGKMLPCGSFSHPYTLPLKEGFRQAWDRLPGLFEDITLPEKCRSCEYANGACANCPAMLQSETGSFHEVSDYICGITKYRANKINEI